MMTVGELFNQNPSNAPNASNDYASSEGMAAWRHVRIESLWKSCVLKYLISQFFVCNNVSHSAYNILQNICIVL